jgi:hypothetical protein
MADIPSLLKVPFEKGIDGVKSFLKIQSPSKVLKTEIGMNMARGITEGLAGGLVPLPSIISDSIGNSDAVSAVTGDTAIALQSIVNQIASINNAISQIPDIDVPLKLEKIGKVLGVKDNALKIDVNPINITLNVKVVLEADKLSEVLLDTGKFMPK